MQEQSCPQCGYKNREGAKFCQKCGHSFLASNEDENQKVSSPAPTQPQTRQDMPRATSKAQSSFFSDLIDEFEYLAEDAKNVIQTIGGALRGEPKKEGRSGQQKGGAPETSSPGGASARAAPTRMISQSLSPKQVGDKIGGYNILQVWSLLRSNYYQVRQLRCPQGHKNSVKQGTDLTHCKVCQNELKVFLARESKYSPPTVDQERQQARRQALIQLSQAGVPAFLRHVSIFHEGDRRFVIVEYPPGDWISLAQVTLPVQDNQLLLEWCMGIGSGLSALADKNFIPNMSSLPEVLEPILLVGQPKKQRQLARFADLTVFDQMDMIERESVTSEMTDPATAVQGRMIAFLSQLIYLLTSGKPQNLRKAPRDFSDIPPPFRSLVSRAVQSQYATLQGFLEALRGAFQVPESTRSLRQIAGYRTDVGKTRDHNEDFVGKYTLGMQQTPDTPEVGLYLVADGMGGHQAGELASKDVVRVILDEIQDKVQELQAAPKLKRATIKIDQVVTTGDVIRSAIMRANEVLFRARQEVGSDRGTTITAAIIVGDACAIANVGDSRTYLLRGGNLSQITRDHSLVASLVAANMIQPDEVRVHPQRSQIYRNLGDRAEVEVDVYEISLQVGDRLLLCSDGLWEMVVDEEIQQVMQVAANPQEVCDILIEKANLAGGEDNISTVAVWMA